MIFKKLVQKKNAYGAYMIKNAHLCPRRAPTATTVEYTQFRVSCLSPAHSPPAAVGVRVPCSLLAVLRTSGVKYRCTGRFILNKYYFCKK